MLGAAFGTFLGNRHEGPAMMAFEPAPESVLDEPGRAVRALEAEAAFAAERDRRIAAAIKKQERLLATCKRFGEGIDQDRREPAPALGRIVPHVDGGELRQAGGLVARS